MTRFTLSHHIITKGFDLSLVVDVLDHPSRVTPVTRYPNQLRYIGKGIAVVVDTVTLTAITVYLDGVITPLREDQKNDAAALSSQRLARRG